MAGQVFFSVSMSLDGYTAPVSMNGIFATPEQREQDPRLERWVAQWAELQAWVFPTRFIRENLEIGCGGEEGLDDDIVRGTFERTGASVMGKRMFDLGEKSWPEAAPFHTSVFVVTHEKRDAWERPGGTTFHFVNDGIEAALDRARDAAGDRDVRIAGGGETIVEYLNAGLVDDFTISLSPVLFGAGSRLFDGVDQSKVALEPVRTVPSPRATHLSYAVHLRQHGSRLPQPTGAPSDTPLQAAALAPSRARQLC
jgi:dihydrofolate reductase